MSHELILKLLNPIPLKKLSSREKSFAVELSIIEREGYEKDSFKSLLLVLKN